MLSYLVYSCDTVVYIRIWKTFPHLLYLDEPKRLRYPKPWYGPSPFSLIGSLLLKDLSFISSPEPLGSQGELIGWP